MDEHWECQQGENIEKKQTEQKNMTEIKNAHICCRIPFLRIYLMDFLHPELNTKIFNVALFVRVKKWRQGKYLSIEES